MCDTNTLEYPVIDNDFYSNSLITIEDDQFKKQYKGLKTFSDIEGHTIISKNSLIKKLELIGDFAIVSASLPNLSKTENIERNKNLRKLLTEKNMHIYLLVGSYKDGFIYSIERLFLIAKPDSLNHNQFIEILEFYLNQFSQKAFIFRKNNEYKYIDANKEIGSLGINLPLKVVEEKYNKYVNLFQGDFSFEGLEIPSTNMGAFFMRLNKIQYIDYPYPKDFSNKKNDQERINKYKEKVNLENIEITNILPEVKEKFLNIPGNSYADKLQTLLTICKVKDT